jgi:hypothetical protein
MDPAFDAFRTILEEITLGSKIRTFDFAPLDDKFPALRFVHFEDYPHKGLTTTFSFGVSDAKHESWTSVKPEFMLTVNSTDHNWFAFLAMSLESLRGKSEFLEGTCYANAPAVPSTESDMSGLCFGSPSALPMNPIQLPDRRILVRDVFPFYFGEAPLIQKMGLKSFVDAVGQTNLSNVKRKDLSYSEEEVSSEHTAPFIALLSGWIQGKFTQAQMERECKALAPETTRHMRLFVNRNSKQFQDPNVLRTIMNMLDVAENG